MRHKTKGIVIRETPKGETSKLLTVLTADLGVITVNGKGVRSLRSPYLKSAQLFAFSDFFLHEKNGFYTLVEASLITDFYSLRNDIKNYSLACYFCDVASSFAIPGEESGTVLRLLLNSLYALESEKNDRSTIKSAFELRLCSECGFLPEIDFCEDCGSELDGCDVLFDVSDGISFCAECAPSHYGLLPLSPSALKAVIHITDSEMSRFISFRIGDNDKKLLSELAERFMLARAERGFSTLSFYKHCEELE